MRLSAVAKPDPATTAKGIGMGANVASTKDFSGQEMAVVQSADVAEYSEWLTFKLGDEEYGIDILCVQEIRSYEQPTRLVQTASSIKGVMNLRGRIVPIVDLRIQFNLPNVQYNDSTVAIVVSVNECVVGMVVDAVSDVTAFTADQLKPSPRVARTNQVDPVQFIASAAERTLLLLDIQKLLNDPEMGLTTAHLQ